ncbi:hypothetical protein D3C77_526510 [compost metagenome]
MVFLDQEGIEQTDAVVVAAAARHCVLLRQAQARQGLAGVEQLDLGIGHLVGKKLGVSRHAREQLQEVQRAALAGQQRTSRAFEVKQRLVGPGPLTILDLPMHCHPRIELAKHRIDPSGASDHAIIARNNGGLGQALSRDQLGGDIATAHVFKQRTAHVGFDFGGQVGET